MHWNQVAVGTSEQVMAHNSRKNIGRIRRARNPRFHFLGDRTSLPYEALVRLLGTKAAGLNRMRRYGLPVPPGFVITTQTCAEFYNTGQKLSRPLLVELRKRLARLEESTGLELGDPSRPLLVSVGLGLLVSLPASAKDEIALLFNPGMPPVV